MTRFLVFTLLSVAIWSDAFAELGAQGDGQPYYGGIEIFGTRSETASEADLIAITERFVDEGDIGTLEDQRRLSYDDAGDGHRIYMGVSSAPDWDWEWGFVDFGKARGRYEGPASSSDVDMRLDTKAEGWFLHVQFSPQISESFEATLKLGVLRWDGSRYARLVRTDGAGSPVDRFETVSGIDEYFGVGLIYNVSERWKIRADVNRYMLADDQLDTFGIAAQFWFSGRLINNIFDL